MVRLTTNALEELWKALPNGKSEEVYDQISTKHYIEDLPRLFSSKDTGLRARGMSLGMLISNVSLGLRRGELLQELVNQLRVSQSCLELEFLLEHLWKSLISYKTGLKFEEIATSKLDILDVEAELADFTFN